MNKIEGAQLKTTFNIPFEEHTAISVSPNHFLSNKNNYAKLLHILSFKLNDKGVLCQQCSNDVNILIVQTTINALSDRDNVTIVGQYVGLLVLITALTPSIKIYTYTNLANGK